MKTHFLIIAALTLVTVTCFSQAAPKKPVEAKQATMNHPAAISNTPVPQNAIKKFTSASNVRPNDSILIRRKLPIDKLKK